MPAASSGIIAHTPFTIQKLIKGPNCMDQLRLQESSGVYISKGGAPAAAAESITTRAFSPPRSLARPPARPKICQRVLPPSAVSPQGFGWSAATLYGLIYLIMLMTKVCLAASWGKSWGGGGIKQTLPAIYPARSESLGFKGLAVCWKCRNNGVFKNNKKKI